MGEKELDGVKERRKVFCFAFHNNKGGVQTEGRHKKREICVDSVKEGKTFQGEF